MEKNINANTPYTRRHDFAKQEQTTLTSTEAIDPYNLQYRVLPHFEDKYYERVQIKKLSLKSNETLASRWRKYIDLCRMKERTPHWFPKNEDYHFSNYYVHYDVPQKHSFVGRKKRLKEVKTTYDNRYRQIKRSQRKKSPSKKLKYVSTF